MSVQIQPSRDILGFLPILRLGSWALVPSLMEAQLLLVTCPPPIFSRDKRRLGLHRILPPARLTCSLLSEDLRSAFLCSVLKFAIGLRQRASAGHLPSPRPVP